MSVFIQNISFRDSGKVIISSGAPPVVGGAVLFDGANQNFTIPGSSDWAPGTGDFTIEWFQYQRSIGTAPRPFSIGGYPSASLAVSLEGGTFYLWANGDPVDSATTMDYIDVWTHFAVCRVAGTVSIFQNGTNIGSSDMSSYDISDSSTVLSIGAEYLTPSAAATFFDGDITNFRWTNAALYTTDFFVPTSPLTLGADTKLLLLETDSGGLLTDATGTHTVTNVNGAVWDAVSPF